MNLSKRDALVHRIEDEILSGHYRPGDRLPAERELAEAQGVSRPLIHAALVELARRGLLRIEARQGVFVADFRRDGSVEMLLSLMNFGGGDLAKPLLDGLLEMRLLFETETARLAARRAGPAELLALERVLARETLFDSSLPREATGIDFDFHLAVALASGNQVYPLLLNSFRPVYERILDRFYSDPLVIPTVFRMHRELYLAIHRRDGEGAEGAMRDILSFGESRLRSILALPKEEA